MENRYYPSRDVQANTYELQEYLKYIADRTDGIPTVYPDGIYGPETRAAVRAFQTKYGYAPSGDVNFETWTGIVEVYDELKKQNRLPVHVAAYPIEIPHLKEGDEYEEIYLLQIMLRRIAKIFKNITMPDLTGVYDRKTAQSAEDFSRIYGRDSMGRVDRELWNILTDTYNAFTYNG